MSTNRRVAGILVEGLNCAGKSTTVDALVKLGERNGVAFRPGHCWLVPDALNEQVHDLAFARVPARGRDDFRDPAFMRGFNVTRSAHVMLDTYLAGERGTVPDLVQDRHWFTQYCSNEYFNPGEGLLSPEWIGGSAPVFDLHVYVTCSDTVRRSRAVTADRGRSRLHRYFLEHVDGLCEFNAFCLEVVHQQPNWLVVDTSSETPDGIARAIFEAYGPAIR